MDNARPLTFGIVVALDAELGIGRGGSIPWHLPSDLAHFKRLTTEAPPGLTNAVIMGRKTYASIPPRFRPLPHRLNVVLSRGGHHAGHPQVWGANSLPAALEELSRRSDVHRIFVIGGGEVYREALLDPRCRTLWVTRIAGQFGCDTFFPAFEPAFARVEGSPPAHESGLTFAFEVYERGD